MFGAKHLPVCGEELFKAGPFYLSRWEAICGAHADPRRGDPLSVRYDPACRIDPHPCRGAGGSPDDPP